MCGMYQMLAFIAMNVTWLWLSEQYWHCRKQFIMYSAVHKSYKWLLLYWVMATNTLIGNLITCFSHSCFVYLIFFVTKAYNWSSYCNTIKILWKLQWILQSDQKPHTHVSWEYHKLLLSKPSPCAGVCRLVAVEVAVSRRRTWSTPRSTHWPHRHQHSHCTRSQLELDHHPMLVGIVSEVKLSFISCIMMINIYFSDENWQKHWFHLLKDINTNVRSV